MRFAPRLGLLRGWKGACTLVNRMCSDDPAKTLETQRPFCLFVEPLTDTIADMREILAINPQIKLNRRTAFHRKCARFATWFLLAAALIAATNRSLGASTPFLSEKEVAKWAIYQPPPRFPYAAYLLRANGTGRFMLRVQIRSGLVERVDVVQTTGWPFMDRAAITTLKQWRFKPGALPRTKKVLPDLKERFATEYVLIGVPITFEPLRDHLGCFDGGTDRVTDGPDPICETRLVNNLRCNRRPIRPTLR